MSSNRNLILWELSHTDTEKGPTIERPQRLFELCEEPSASSPRPHYRLEDGRRKETHRHLTPSITHLFILFTPTIHYSLFPREEWESNKPKIALSRSLNLSTLSVRYSTTRETMEGTYMSIGGVGISMDFLCERWLACWCVLGMQQAGHLYSVALSQAMGLGDPWRIQRHAGVAASVRGN